MTVAEFMIKVQPYLTELTEEEFKNVEEMAHQLKKTRTGTSAFEEELEDYDRYVKSENTLSPPPPFIDLVDKYMPLN